MHAAQPNPWMQNDFGAHQEGETVGLSTCVPGQDNEEVRGLIEKLRPTRRSTKLLPIVMLAWVEPRVDLIDKNRQ